MNRINYEIYIYEGSENFTDQMVQEIQEMSGEQGCYFEYTGASIDVKETAWDADADIIEWSKKYPKLVFEIHSEIEDVLDILYIKNGKFRHTGEHEEYREELLVSDLNEIKEVKCFSWTDALFFAANERNPQPKSVDEKFIVVGTNDLITASSFTKGKWDAPFKVIYWKYI